MAEAVDRCELVDARGAAQLVEHAASSDGLELAVVADEHQSPPLGRGELCECVEVSGPQHPCLVDDQRGVRREPVLVMGLPVAPLVEQLGDRGGLHAGLVPEDLGRLGGGGDGEDMAPLGAQVGGGPAERGCLAGAGWSNDEHERVVAGDGCGGIGLEDVEPGPVQSGRRASGLAVGVDGEQEDPLLLGEDTLGGEVRFDRGDPDGPAVGCSPWCAF